MILFIAPFYRYRPILPESLVRQTCGEWRLLLIHDGPGRRLRHVTDERITLAATSQRHNDYGHSLRAFGLRLAAQQNLPGDWIVHTNGDNYYVPGFCEQMLTTAAERPSLVGFYCDCLHNHYGWSVLNACLRIQQIDCGCLMVRREAAVQVGWPGRDFTADWTYIASLVQLHGAEHFVKIPRPLFVHN